MSVPLKQTGEEPQNQRVQESLRTPEVAEWTSAALSRLTADRSEPDAWVRFLGDSLRRWRQDGRELPQLRRSLRSWLLTGSAGAIGARLLGTGRWPGRTSWAWLVAASLMADWHLGMIPSPSKPSPLRIGLPNRLTLLRALLPAAFLGLPHGPRTQRLRAAIAVTALASDFLDGQLAGRSNGRTHFGAVADPLSDAAFWTALTVSADRGASSRVIAGLTVLRYGVPVGAAVCLTFIHGRTYDWHHNRFGRWSSAVLTMLLALREVRLTRVAPRRADHCTS